MSTDIPIPPDPTPAPTPPPGTDPAPLPAPPTEPAPDIPPTPPDPTPDPPTPSSPRRIARGLHRALVWPGWMNVASMLTTVVAVGALWFTSNTLRVSQDQTRATQDQLELSRRSAVTDMFQKAVEMLRTDAEPGTALGGGIDSRIAGIHLLERLALESPRDRILAYQTLATFVRTRAPLSECEEWDQLVAIPDGPTARVAIVKWIEQRRDVAEALEVIGKRSRDANVVADDIDLQNTCLRSQAFDNFAHANFRNADLAEATFQAADLTGADFHGANLNRADFVEANLTDADLEFTDLISATFYDANLTDANLSWTTLADARLSDANLTRANLTRANLECAQMGATTELRGANLTDVYYTENMRWPEGFTPPPSSASEAGSPPRNCE